MNHNMFVVWIASAGRSTKNTGRMPVHLDGKPGLGFTVVILGSVSPEQRPKKASKGAPASHWHSKRRWETGAERAGVEGNRRSGLPCLN